MVYVFIAVLFAALAGVIKPYIKGWGRGRFGIVALAAFLLGVAVTPVPDQDGSATGGQQAETEATETLAGPSNTGSGRDARSESDQTADEVKQYAWIRVGEDAIKTKLKDPDSAQFRDVRFYSGGGIPVICGEVNAKNSFGGFGGFERFVAAGDSFAYLESEVSDGLGPVWERYCKAKPTDKAYQS